MTLFVGVIEGIVAESPGRVAIVSVLGARVEVALDLVPGAQPGDEVLCHAGVALSVLQEDSEGRPTCV